MLKTITNPNGRFSYIYNALNLEIYVDGEEEPFGSIQLQNFGTEVLMVDTFYRGVTKKELRVIKKDWAIIEDFLRSQGIKKILVSIPEEQLKHGTRFGKMMGFNKPRAAWFADKEI